MKKQLKQIVKKAVGINNSNESANKQIVSSVPKREGDYTDFEYDVIKKTNDYTMTGPTRVISLLRAIDYVVVNNIEGAIVECGVWKGGSIMAAMEALNKRNEVRELYLYDTYEGMSEPTEADASLRGEMASDLYKIQPNNKWCYSTLDEVKQNIGRIKYPEDKKFFIQGKVEDTIPEIMPEKIALLRLDTDWYESTIHELEHLYPRLSKGGILIIDDYGHWTGCKKAVDEYFTKNNIKVFLNRVDYTCRLAVKN